MSVFETIKETVSVPDAANYYGLHVGRNGMICCPFHDDRNPSMKLYDRHYYCFGCGEHGDVIDLCAKLFHIGLQDAVKKLMEDFGIDPDKPPAAAILRKPERRTEKDNDTELYCFRILCNYLHLLEEWKVRFAPKTQEDKPDDRFVEALQMYESTAFIADVLSAGEPETRKKTVEILMKNGKMQYMEERLKRIEQEDAYERAA